MQFKGCTSCFACKKRGGKSYGKCVLHDDLTPVLDAITTADALIIGSPIYFGSVTGETRSFFERLVFPFFTYTVPYGSLFAKKVKTGLIYTMNVPRELSTELGYDYIFSSTEHFLQVISSEIETLCAFDTCQVEDYAKYMIESFDPVHKANRRREIFPLEMQRAFEMGQRLVSPDLHAGELA